MSKLALIYVRNDSQHKYVLNNVEIEPNSNVIVYLKRNKEHKLHGNSNLSFRINSNGLIEKLSKYLSYGCNTHYIPVEQNNGNRTDVLWPFQSCIPHFYQEKKHLVIMEHH